MGRKIPGAHPQWGLAHVHSARGTEPTLGLPSRKRGTLALNQALFPFSLTMLQSKTQKDQTFPSNLCPRIKFKNIGRNTKKPSTQNPRVFFTSLFTIEISHSPTRSCKPLSHEKTAPWIHHWDVPEVVKDRLALICLHSLHGPLCQGHASLEKMSYNKWTLTPDKLE